jgi:quercetin dioxygenase-like cupin family protein
MAAGDMVLQPPGIRHRVLESAAGLEVVEITCPALHETFADHDLTLPNGAPDPSRAYDGQRFMHQVAATALWRPWHGAEAQTAALSEATEGQAEARIVRPGPAAVLSVPPHDGELVFGFVLEGAARLDRRGDHSLGPADAFTIPPGEAWRLSAMSGDFRLLHLTTRAFGWNRLSRPRSGLGNGGDGEARGRQCKQDRRQPHSCLSALWRKVAQAPIIAGLAASRMGR